MLETWIPGVKRGSVPAFLVKGGHSSHVPLHCNNWNFASSAIKFSPHHIWSRGGGLTLLQCSSNAMFVSNKTIFLSGLTSERRRHSMVNNMGAIQVWLRNNSVLAFWICFEYDNEHSDVRRVTCDVLHWSRNNISLYFYWSTSTFLCPHDIATEIFQAEQTES